MKSIKSKPCLHLLIERKLMEIGADEKTAKGLLAHGDKGLTAWVIDNLCSSIGSMGVLEMLDTFSDIVQNEVSPSKVKSFYYNYNKRTLSDLRKKEEYDLLRSMLEESLPNAKFWDEVLPYAYKNAHYLGVDLCLDQNVPCKDIADMLCLSPSKTYEIRNLYLERNNLEK